MKNIYFMFSLIALAVSLCSQTTNNFNKIYKLTSSSASNSSNSLATPPSYYQQLRDLEKTENERANAETVKRNMEAPMKEYKERIAKEKLMRLEMEELAIQKKKEDLANLEEKRQLKQRMLYDYITKVQKQGTLNNRVIPKLQLDNNPSDPLPTTQIKPVQEAMKAEPPPQ